MAIILFIDDEDYRTRRYRENLIRYGYEVKYCKTLDDAFGLMDNPDVKISLLVQDMQMGRPSPDDAITMTNAEWEEYKGLAGLWFLVQKRDWLISRKIPVLILTQRNPDEFKETVDLALSAKGVMTRITLKRDTGAAALPSFVKKYFHEVEKSRQTNAY